MTDVKILELGGSNFRGQNFCDKYGLQENRISGRNRSGKSTRLAAWCWLMCAYTDPNSPANSKLFDDRIELTKDTPVASVWAVVQVGNESYRLERTAKAKFTRKKGTDIYEKAPSDEYGYSIDNIERNATDFKDWLTANIAPDDMMRFVLGGEFFISQIFDDKKKARQIIERIVGEVTPEEMKGDYTLIADLLAKYSLDEIENRAANLSKGIKQRLDEIPSLIQSMTNEISEIEQTDFAANEKEITRLEGEREACEKRQLDLTERIKPQMEARAKTVADRQMKQTLFDEAYRKWCNEPQEEINRLTGEINAVRRQNADSKAKYDDAVRVRQQKTTERDNAIRELKLAEQRREQCIIDRDKEIARTMDPSAKVCQYCGAELTGEKLKEAVDKFEFVKRENIQKIVARGKSENAEIERLTKIAEDAQPFIDAPIPEVLNQSTEKLEKRIAELTGRSTSKEVFAATDHGKELQAAIDAIVIPEVKMPDDSDIKAEKDRINTELVPLYEKRGLKSRAEKLRNNIEELRKEQRDKGVELAIYERQRQLVKDYKQEQMEILSHKVNDGLKFSRIEVWSKQKDGTIIPDLVLKDTQGVSYSTTNNASRIVTAIDVQRFFCEKLGVNMPCWVDECAVVDDENMPRFDGTQMFYIFRADTSLKIESK